MELQEEVKDVCSKEISTLPMVEQKVLEELTSETENPYAAIDFSKLSPKANPASPPECGGSEFDHNMISLHNHLTAHLSLCSLNDACMNMKEVTTSADREVPSAILNCPLKSVNKDANAELVTEWRLGMGDFPLVLSECADSYDSSLSERSSVTSSPCTSFTAHSDTWSEDLDGVDIWVSSLDLNEEDSDLLQDKEQDLGFLSSDFPSPSFSAVRRSLQFCPSSSSPATSHGKQANDSDEPIFWPFERASYHSPEFEEFLLVSPRRTTMDVESAETRRLNPIVKRLHKNKLSSARRSVEPHRGSVSLGAKGIISSQDKVQRATAVPSWLSRTTKTSSSKHQQPSNCEKRKPSHLKISPPRKDRYPQLQSGYTVQELEASDLQKLVAEKILIEQFIGLDEFDGHEGISSDSSNNQFSLFLSPR